MPKFNLEISTDNNGYFNQTTVFDPPGQFPFPLRVNLTVTMNEPVATEVIAVVDIDAEDGNPTNQEKQFVLATGDVVPLGSWRLDGGKNIVVLRGRTMPSRPSTKLMVEIEATLN